MQVKMAATKYLTHLTTLLQVPYWPTYARSAPSCLQRSAQPCWEVARRWLRSREHDPHGHSLRGARGDTGGHWNRACEDGNPDPDRRQGAEESSQAPHSALVSQPNRRLSKTDLKDSTHQTPFKHQFNTLKSHRMSKIKHLRIWGVRLAYNAVFLTKILIIKKIPLPKLCLRR